MLFATFSSVLEPRTGANHMSFEKNEFWMPQKIPQLIQKFFVEPLGIRFLLKSPKSQWCEIKSPYRLESYFCWNSKFLKISAWGSVDPIVGSAGGICRFDARFRQFGQIIITSDFDLRLYREWMIWKKRYGGNRLRAVSGGSNSFPYSDSPAGRAR